MQILIQHVGQWISPPKRFRRWLDLSGFASSIPIAAIEDLVIKHVARQNFLRGKFFFASLPFQTARSRQTIARGPSGSGRCFTTQRSLLRGVASSPQPLPRFLSVSATCCSSRCSLLILAIALPSLVQRGALRLVNGERHTSAPPRGNQGAVLLTVGATYRRHKSIGGLCFSGHGVILSWPSAAS